MRRRLVMRRLLVVLACAAAALVAAPAAAIVGRIDLQSPTVHPLLNPSATPNPLLQQKIQHIVIITQENRSFDHYFGTYPGADGIPMNNGVPTVCVPDPRLGICATPYPNHADSNYGGPHGHDPSVADVDGGRMDGFIKEAETMKGPAGTNPDVMGYHDGGDLPNYWAYAQNYVLFDHFFAPMSSWSLPTHLAMFSGWSALCSNPNDPLSCNGQLAVAARNPNNPVPYAWTDLTYLLNAHGITWACYLEGGDTGNESVSVPVVWDVLPGFADVVQDGQLGNDELLTQFFTDAQNGTLPAVSWILPDFPDSEHPAANGLPSALVSQGQSYVTNIVNAVMASPNWSTTAIFLWWDDWGGFYDHLKPKNIDAQGLGIRVPAILIGPYAKKGFIDHHVFSSDSFLRVIEDDFLNGQRLDPATDSRPDSRPDVRENAIPYGVIVNDLRLGNGPRPPMILPINPPTTLQAAHRRLTRLGHVKGA